MILYLTTSWTREWQELMDACPVLDGWWLRQELWFGTMDDKAWSMTSVLVREDGSTVFRRTGGEEPYRILVNAGPYQCGARSVKLWVIQRDSDTLPWFCWAWYVGYATHIGPQLYLLPAGAYGRI